MTTKLSASPSAILFDEVMDDGGASPQISATRTSRSTVRTGYVSNTQLDAAIDELFPLPPGIPARHPTVNYLFASSLQISPAPRDIRNSYTLTAFDGNQIVIHDRYKLSITYATTPYTDFTRRHTISFSNELINFDSGGNVFWMVDSVYTPIGGVKLDNYKAIAISEHSVSYNRIDALAYVTSMTNLRNSIGKINSDTFSLDGVKLLAPETILLAGAQISYEFVHGGVQSFRFDLRFQERHIKDGLEIFGWNHALNEYADGGAEWQRVSLNGTSYKPLYGSVAMGSNYSP